MSRLSPPSEVSGYVLAGGKSSRMGRDKALLELAGRPLIDHAVTKLRRVCAEVAVLSANPALIAFAPLVPDLRAGCGPLGGIEAALAHSARDWCLILPVDVPFLPSAMLDFWVRSTLRQAGRDGTRMAMFLVDGRPQPALLLIHRDVSGYVSSALGRGEFKLLPVLVGAAQDLGAKRGLTEEQVLRRWAWNVDSRFSAGASEPPGEAWTETTPAQEDSSHLYFSNLNTPEEFADAERQAHVLDT